MAVPWLLPTRVRFSLLPGLGKDSDQTLFSFPVRPQIRPYVKCTLCRNHHDGVCKNTQRKVISLVKALQDFGPCRTTLAGLQTPIIRPTFPPALNTSFSGRKIND